MKAIRNTTYESWAAKKLNKVSKQPWTMQYPAFSLKMDLSMGLLEGLSSFIGYALMLAVNSFFSSSLGYSPLLTVTCRLWLWMFGFLLRSSWALSSAKPHLEGLNGVFPLLKHMQRRVSVVKIFLDVMRNVCTATTWNVWIVHRTWIN